jgi:hypothetical protein
MNYAQDLVSATVTGTGTADVTYTSLFGGAQVVADWLEVQEAVTPSVTDVLTPTLDSVVQGSLDGVNYADLVAFTQRTTTAATERKCAHRSASLIIGCYYRIKSSVATGNTTVASYACTWTALAGVHQ